jgi:hypothetical protein
MKANHILKAIILFAFISFYTLVNASTSPKFQFYGLLNAARNNGAWAEQLSAQLNVIVPADLRDNMTISFGNSGAWNYLTSKNDYNIGNGDNYLSFAKRIDKQGFKFCFEICDPSFPAWPDTFKIPNYDSKGVRIDRFSFTDAHIDSVFRNCPNCIGVKTGEVFWAYDTSEDWLIRVLRVCKKYNKKAYISEGVWLDSHWMKFFYQKYNELHNEGLGAYLVPEFKNTKPAAAYFTMSSLMGAWLTDEVGDIGMYNDHWVWCYQSFGHANQYPAYRKADGNQSLFPFIFTLRQWMLGAAMGCNSFTIEPPNFSRDGIKSPNCERYLFPFMRGMIAHNIVPQKSKVIEKAKAFINPFGNYPDGKVYNPSELFINYLDVFPGWQRSTWSASWIDPFGILYRNSLGFSQEKAYQDTVVARVYYANVKSKVVDYFLRENIPNESKYYFLPIQPHPASQIPASMATINLKDFRTDETMKAKLDEVFTDAPTHGNAWQTEIDNSFFVLNTHENTDIDETYSFNLGGTFIKSMNGIMPFQNILFGKREGSDRFWFQVNGYVGDGVSAFQTYQCVFKPSTVRFVCEKEPVVIVENSKSQYVTKTWDEQTHTLTLVCDHTQAGAINFVIQGDVNSAVQQPKKECPMTVFPNPCNDNLSLKYKFSQSGVFSVSIHDMLGRKVLHPVVNKNCMEGEGVESINLSALCPGEYICKVMFDKSLAKQLRITKI